jgi:glycosyltransferase involved in cell wall biosynthesis
MLASVIICTHNPNAEFLNRAIFALRKQTLPTEDWELLLLDNASSIAIAETHDISWHPNGRYIIEEALGLTQARIRGIKEAKGELIVFVDDDNCLKEDYLDILTKTMNSMPLLGTLGAGRIIPEFEVKPTLAEVPFLRSLALRYEDRSHFSNDISYHKALPFGAGICIRRSIALTYGHSCATRPLAASLDRNGKSLLSGGDIDLALHACRDGYLAGVLLELELIHLIPKERLDHKYLIKLAAGHAASNYIISQLWNFEQHPENPIVKWGRYLKKRIFARGLERKIIIVEYRAEKEARKTWMSLNF